MIKDVQPLGLHRKWLSPFPVEMRGGLGGRVRHYSDPDGTILSPKVGPAIKRSNDQGAVPFVAPCPDPPVGVSGFMVMFNDGFSGQASLGSPTTVNVSIPASGSYVYSMAVTFTSCYNGVITYLWKKDGADHSTSRFIDQSVGAGDPPSTTVWTVTLSFSNGEPSETYQITVDAA
jgi:hypothetical protein